MEKKETQKARQKFFFFWEWRKNDERKGFSVNGGDPSRASASPGTNVLKNKRL